MFARPHDLMHLCLPVNDSPADSPLEILRRVSEASVWDTYCTVHHRCRVRQLVRRMKRRTTRGRGDESRRRRLGGGQGRSLAEWPERETVTIRKQRCSLCLRSIYAIQL